MTDRKHIWYFIFSRYCSRTSITLGINTWHPGRPGRPPFVLRLAANWKENPVILLEIYRRFQARNVICANLFEALTLFWSISGVYWRYPVRYFECVCRYSCNPICNLQFAPFKQYWSECKDTFKLSVGYIPLNKS